MPVVIPVAALEQHGRHMPVFTDSLLLGEVMRRVERATAPTASLFTPLMWLGNSDHHLDFPGTLSASPRVYLDLLSDMVENFLFTASGGSCSSTATAATSCRASRRCSSSGSSIAIANDLLLLFATYWTLGAEAARRPTRTRCSRRWATPASGRRR